MKVRNRNLIDLIKLEDKYLELKPNIELEPGIELETVSNMSVETLDFEEEIFFFALNVLKELEKLNHKIINNNYTKLVLI